MSALREHRLRMELHPFDRQIPVPQSHDDAACGSRGDLQVSRQGGFVHGQGMVPSSGERIRQSVEHAGPVMPNLTGLAVQQFRRAGYDTAESYRNRLVTEADAENRFLTRNFPNQPNTDAGLLRCAWTR